MDNFIVLVAFCDVEDEEEAWTAEREREREREAAEDGTTVSEYVYVYVRKKRVMSRHMGVGRSGETSVWTKSSRSCLCVHARHHDKSQRRRSALAHVTPLVHRSVTPGTNTNSICDETNTALPIVQNHQRRSILLLTSLLIPVPHTFSGSPTTNSSNSLSTSAQSRAAFAADSDCPQCENSNSIATTPSSGGSTPVPSSNSFVTTASGLRVLDVVKGEGASPSLGDTCIIDYSMYTSGYQGKLVARSSSKESDFPFTFTLGREQAIPAIEEAVMEMKVGGVRRIEVPGSLVQNLAYPITPPDGSSSNSRDFNRYARGPVPDTFGGRRALDFVLDNKTLRDFNRTLLINVRLVKVK